MVTLCLYSSCTLALYVYACMASQMHPKGTPGQLNAQTKVSQGVLASFKFQVSSGRIRLAGAARPVGRLGPRRIPSVIYNISET